VAAMRRELGRQLADRRKAAGYLQRELGVLVGYSRTAIANAETGATSTGRQLWKRADQVLGTGELFARGYDRIQAQIAAESRASARRQASAAVHREAQHTSDGLESLMLNRARQAYLERDWPVEEGAGGRLWLVTGTVIDVLEVPRQAGMVAMGWWLYTRGVPDEIRGLPALPDPVGALAVISTGSVCYFLTRSGNCPWTGRDIGPAGAASSASPVVVRWHADEGHVPAPPSPLDGGERAAWAHVPSVGGQLVSPMALLHLLAYATAATREGAGLLLPDGVRAVPAAMPDKTVNAAGS
jgi:transcriptional regulator with XRE-family HTH domain